VKERLGMSRTDFTVGYALAAGYGYVKGSGAAAHHLGNLFERASAGLQVTPETAGPLPSEGARPWMLHPPGYPFLVSIAHRILGMPADIPMMLLGLLLDTVAAGLVWWIATRLLGSAVGLAAGLIYAAYPPYAYWSSVSKSVDGILAVFIVGCLACVVQAAGERGWRAWAWFVGSGLVLGLGCYMRPDYMLMPAILALGVYARNRRLREAILAAVVIQATVFATLLPWALRNHAIAGRWIFSSTSVGGTLINSLGEAPNPWGYGPFDEDRHKEAQALGWVDAWSPEADAHFRALFRKNVIEQPRAYAVLLARRLPMALGTPYSFGYENPYKTQTFGQAQTRGQTYIDVLSEKPWYVLAAYWDLVLMAFLSLCGTGCAAIMIWLERRRMDVLLLALGPHLYSLGTHFLTFLWPRYILPSVFCWLIAMAYVAVRCRDRLHFRAAARRAPTQRA
ncbi:MAG TPA: glycosyltransferase family 39 protein, partial [Candidatus Polarisedimenticolia bacterium]|nr:glycosyltransferase family 39 protein [Candidatus Polarisedimenticolia bacterium]